MKKILLTLIIIIASTSFLYSYEEELWLNTGKDVYYQNGNVGIKKVPTAGVELDVNGDINSTNLNIVNGTATGDITITSGTFTNLKISGGFIDFNVDCSSGISRIRHNDNVGIENQYGILLDDNRTGTTADEDIEASIGIDAEGYTALHVIDGVTRFGTDVYCSDKLVMAGTDDIVINDGLTLNFGTASDSIMGWGLNDDQDDLLIWEVLNGGNATNSASIWFTRDMTPWGCTETNNYLSPTLWLVNDEGADANDFTAVVIGGRDTSDVTARHYTSFWSMTGAADGSVDGTSTEIASTFMVGASSSAAVISSNIQHGSVIITEDLQVDGALYPGRGTSVPTTGYEDGSFFWDTDDFTMYVSTETVLGAFSWKALAWQ